jgi:hypothetical protein
MSSAFPFYQAEQGEEKEERGVIRSHVHEKEEFL